MGINQTFSFHIPRNLKRFQIKPNIGIIKFLGIQIAMNHVPKNLDAKNNIDFLVPTSHKRIGDLFTMCVPNIVLLLTAINGITYVANGIMT